MSTDAITGASSGHAPIEPKNITWGGRVEVYRALVVGALLLGSGLGANAWAADGDLRLEDGPDSNEGRLEIYKNNEWGTVCNDFFFDLDATVACRQMGFLSGSVLFENPWPGAETQPIWMDNVICAGNETRLDQCPHITDHNCFHYEDVAISCTGTLSSTSAVSITAESETVTEGAMAEVSLTRRGSIEDELSLSIQVVETGTMLASPAETPDGTPIPRRVTFVANAATVVLQEATVDDTTDEPDSTITFCPDTAGGDRYVIDPPVCVSVTVLDNDDPESVLSVMDASGAEDTAGNLSFAVGLNEASQVEVAVDYATSDGTAEAGSDYTATSGTLTFAAGEMAKSIDVAVAQDDSPEEDETFTLTLSNAVNAALGDGSATGTILDDDAWLSIADAAASEADGALEFVVKADGLVKTNQTVTVDYSTADGTATAGSDYTSNSGTLTFTSTDTEQTITVTVIDDTVDEPDERLAVDLTNPMNATIGDARAEGTIRDNDATSSEITLTASPDRVSEGDGATSVTVTATLDGGARTSATEVTVSVAGSGNPDAVGFQDVSSFTITIAAGDRSGTGIFTLTPEDDAVDEADETVTVSGAADLPVESATVTLADDDEAPTGISLSVVPSRVSEGGGAAQVTVTAAFDRGARPMATTVSVSVAGSGAAGAVDFAPVAGFEIVIPANAATGSAAFTLTPEDDAFDEVDETLTVSGASDLPVESATVTLADDDEAPTRVSLSVVPSRVSEGGGAAQVTVTAAFDRGARPMATTVSVSVAGSGAAGAVDFAPVAGFEIVIPANATSGSAAFALTPEDDVVDELDETVTVSGASDLPVESAQLTLADDDQAPTRISLSAVPSRVSEGGGAAAVTVTAAFDRGARPMATTVTVSVAGSGAAGAVDFAPVPDFEIVIPASATSGSAAFALTPEDDVVDELDETVTVSGASDLPVESALVTLADDDATSTRISLSAAPALVSEGAGTTEVTVSATLDGGARATATMIAVSVSGSGDPDAVDFAPVADFDIVIPANAPSGSGTFTVVPEDDLIAEADELLTVSGASDLPVRPATVELLDDDEASGRILLSADPARASEGDGPVAVTVTALLDRSPRQRATAVTVSVSGGGDPDAVDFAPVADFDIMIPANAPNGTGTFTVVPEDDLIAEADELLTVSGASDLPVRPATVELLDDDEASGRILLSADPARASEGDGPVAVTVTALLDRSPRQRATAVTVSVSGGGDPDAVDFAPVADFDIVIPANAPNGTGTFTVVPEDDLIAEADELLTVSGASDLLVTPATVELLDDDEASGRVLLSAAPARVSEGDGPVAVTVTALLDRSPRQRATAVTVSVSGGGDPDAVDFDPVPDFDIVIPANAPNGTGTFSVVPEDDLIAEKDEVLTVSGASDLPVTPATVELLDDDEASGRVLLSADPARVSEGGGPVAVTVTAALDRGLRQEATTVTVSVSGGGDPDAVDFAPVANFGITIAANAPSGTGTFTLTPEDDAEDEADETLALTGEADLPVTPASVVLADDDEMTVSRVLSIADAQASEGAGEVRFAVTLDGPSAAEVTADYATVNPVGSSDPVAEPGIDYKSVAGTLTFAPGEVSKTIRVPIVDDDLDEPDETFALVLSDLRGATLGRGSARGAILDDDEPPALSIAGDTGPEDVGELVFSVTLMARALTEVTVNYATMDDTAVAGDDYGQVEGTLTFAPGETAKRIRVAVVDDAVDEADEEVFAVRLSGPSGATLAHALATGVIRDDDEPPALSVADAAGDEDVGALEFAVTLSAPSGIEVSAPYATKDGTATAGSDYAAATGSLVFAPGEVSRTIRVAILDDALHEADEETFELTLARLVNATPADVSATGTIRDNDLAPPSVAGDLPAALLCVGGAPYELDLANYFAGEELRFSAVSSTPLVATAALDGSKLTVAPASEGASSVTVTATNDAGSVGSSIGVRVVTDAAELEAVESVLASIGRAVLTGVTDSVRARFDPGRAFGDQSASTSVQRGRTQVVPDAYSVIGSQRPGAPMPGARSVGWDGSGLFQPQISGDDWFETMNRTYRGGMVPFSFSLDSAQSPSTGPAWGVWGRADAHRFESGTDGSSHDGTLTAVHLGADARVGDWLAGVSVARSAAQANYRFERSVDACGGSGSGEGMVDAELTSVHPYVGRQIGRGQVWATLGAGGGEVSVERCETGQRNDADLSMRLAALGGRHPFAGGEPIELSVVEEIGVLDLTTGNAVGPVGDRSVRVGQARFGLEASGVAPAGCDCSLTTFVRAFARGDWGDGATGTGLELAAGVRFRNLPRRLGIDAGVRALAAHSAEDAEERSANLSFSMLPKADGTGWQASMTWRLGASEARLDALGGITRWTAPSGSLPGAKRHWLADSRLGYGIRLRRGFATPFVELDAGHSQRGGARFGMRHQYGDRMRGLVVEWGIEPSGFGSDGSKILLQALGRF